MEKPSSSATTASYMHQHRTEDQRQMVADPRLGAASKTYHRTLLVEKNRPVRGPYGIVKFALPVFHGAASNSNSSLQCVCKAFKGITKTRGTRKTTTSDAQRADVSQKQGIHKRVLDGRGQRRSAPLRARNEPVRRVAGAGALRVAHDIWKGVA